MPSNIFRLAAAAAFALSAQAQQFVMYTGGMPDGDDTAIERIDPIVDPGSIGGHVHQVFGSNKLAPEVNYDSLLESTCTTVGAANGDGNAQDHSLYWVPALYMKAKNNTGYIRVPMNGHKLYYKNSGSNEDVKADPFEFPEGFRMIAGDYAARAPAEPVQRQNITQWVCHSSGPWNQGTYGGFPNHVTDCDAYPGFNGALHFPHCWNGDAFNQSAPTAHMSYPDGDIENGKCPASHPTRLPHIFMENEFNLHTVVDVVEPNTFVLAQGDPTGYGWHADFFNGWEAGAIPALFDSCPQGNYGNEDIGSCPTFKAGSKTGSCRLPVTYSENVNDPGQYLPGCNPVTTQNPAPMFPVEPQGVSTDSCAANSNDAKAPVAAAPEDPSEGASIKKTPTKHTTITHTTTKTSTIKHTTTKTVPIKHATTKPAHHKHVPHVATAVVNDVVYATKFVTVRA